MEKEERETGREALRKKERQAVVRLGEDLEVTEIGKSRRGNTLEGRGVYLCGALPGLSVARY